jgi:hypothetical protein
MRIFFPFTHLFSVVIICMDKSYNKNSFVNEYTLSVRYTTCNTTGHLPYQIIGKIFSNPVTRIQTASVV